MTFALLSSSANTRGRSKKPLRPSFVPSGESLDCRQMMAVDMVGVVRGPSQWLLDTDFDASHEIERTFGATNDRVIAGKWNGRLDTPGVVRNGRDGLLYWLLDNDGDTIPDQQIAFGRKGDQVVVGDWDGDGRDNVGTVRSNASGNLVWYLDLNGDAQPKITLTFGRAGQTAVVGDWDGDGRATVGVVSPGSDGMLHWLIDAFGNGATTEYAYGLKGDQPIVGDWNNDGKSNLGVVRAEADGFAHWYLDTNGDKWADQTRLYGFATDRFVVGVWHSQNPLDGEPRPASRLTAMLSTTGTLLIDGTNAADSIDLRQSSGTISLTEASIIYAGQAHTSLPSSRVQRIEIRGFGRNDTIRLNGGNEEIRVPTMISGGDGDDVITAGAGADVIYGGTKIDACTEQSRLLVGDFDGNGHPDMLFYTYDSTYGLIVRTHLSKADGNYVVHTSVMGDGAADGPLLAADVNGDGKDELVHHYFDRVQGLIVRVKEISAGGTWTSRQYVLADGQSGTQLLAGNLFGDRRDELVYYTFDAKLGMVVRAKSLNADGTWSSRQWILGDGATNVPLLAGDVNGDTFDDLVYAHYDPTKGLIVRVKTLNASGSWTSKETVFGDGSNLVPLALADVTGDGLADILYAYVDKANNLILRTKAARVDGNWDRRQTVIPGAGSFRELVVGSVDGDQRPDVSILINGDSGLVAQSYSMESNGAWSTRSLYVGDRADTIRGGAGNDTIVAGNAADVIFGEDGADELYGDDGNDRLRGGLGTDKLFGGSGNDGLFGGVEDGALDLLVGGAGSDRLLSAHPIAVDSDDALLLLQNTPMTTTNGYGFGQSVYGPGNWTDERVHMIDVALGNIHRLTGNNRLLTHSGQTISLWAVGELLSGEGVGGWNRRSNSSIAITESSFAAGERRIWEVVYHEFGHNWDEPDENTFNPEFRGISQWHEHYTIGDTPSTAKGDNWYFRDVATNFAREYGMWSPFEDYATTWETYFLNKYHGGSNNRVITSKIENLEKFFASLA